MNRFITFFHSKDFETQKIILGQLVALDFETQVRILVQSLALDDDFEGSDVLNFFRHVLMGKDDDGATLEQKICT